MTLVLRYPLNNRNIVQDISTKNYKLSVAKNLKLVKDPTLGPVAYFDGSASMVGPKLLEMSGRSKRTVAYWCYLEGENFAFVHSSGTWTSTVWATTVWQGRLRLVANKKALYSPRVAPRKWYHVCETFDGSKISFYLNGVLAQRLSKAVTTARTNITLGSNTKYPAYRFKGRLSDFRIFNGALSDSQVAKLYAFDSRRLLKEIPGKIRFKFSGSTSFSCSVEGDPAVDYRVEVGGQVKNNVKSGDTVTFEGLAPSTKYNCKLYKM